MKEKPKPLNWSRIDDEVERAAREMGSPRFINAAAIVEHIQKNEGKYPFIYQRSEWHPNNPVTTDSLNDRAITSILRMKWKPWNSGKSRSVGRVFLLPWVPEDPAVVFAREGRAAES